MRTFRPDRLSKQYIEELRLWQVRFLKEMTVSEETDKVARAAWPYDGIKYVKGSFKVKDNGTQKGSDDIKEG